VSGRSRPGVDAVAELLDHVGPALDALDGSADVRAAVDRIVRQGNGAERQRAALAEVGLPAALTALRLRPTGEARPQPAPAA
jgi:carboxylate-amine ligase